MWERAGTVAAGPWPIGGSVPRKPRLSPSPARRLRLPAVASGSPSVVRASRAGGSTRTTAPERRGAGILHRALPNGRCVSIWMSPSPYPEPTGLPPNHGTAPMVSLDAVRFSGMALGPDLTGCEES
uniref:Uncharacterized protein n=1 Tax=Oryza brachyantha TaxID=4533 RepID=J3LHP5_ORYBR